MDENLYERVYATVRQIPYGKVASYGQVAEATGLHRGARMIGWALRALKTLDSDVPWQRVVNRKGVISIINPKAPPILQAQILEEEGVEVQEVDGSLRVGASAWWHSPSHE